jgi:hypothetical protein
MVELVPDSVGFAKFRELRRNGATADFTLPKITCQKCNKNPNEKCPKGTQTIDIRYRHFVPGDH